jgi:hypothetical protein
MSHATLIPYYHASNVKRYMHFGCHRCDIREFRVYIVGNWISFAMGNLLAGRDASGKEPMRRKCQAVQKTECEKVHAGKLTYSRPKASTDSRKMCKSLLCLAWPINPAAQHSSFLHTSNLTSSILASVFTANPELPLINAVRSRTWVVRSFSTGIEPPTNYTPSPNLLTNLSRGWIWAPVDYDKEYHQWHWLA